MSEKKKKSKKGEEPASPRKKGAEPASPRKGGSEDKKTDAAATLPEGLAPDEAKKPDPWDSDYSSDWSDDDKPLKKIRDKKDRAHEMDKLYDQYDVCGILDITLVGGRELVPKSKGKTPGGKLLYVKISLSWPPWIPEHKSECAVTEEGEDEVFWNDTYSLQKVYTRGGDDVKNAWLKFPKMIFVIKQKTSKITSKKISQGELFLGRIIQPREDAVLEKQEVDDVITVPMLKKDGSLLGELDVKVRFTAGQELLRPEEDRDRFNP